MLTLLITLVTVLVDLSSPSSPIGAPNAKLKSKSSPKLTLLALLRTRRTLKPLKLKFKLRLQTSLSSHSLALTSICPVHRFPYAYLKPIIHPPLLLIEVEFDTSPSFLLLSPLLSPFSYSFDLETSVSVELKRYTALQIANQSSPFRNPFF